MKKKNLTFIFSLTLLFGYGCDKALEANGMKVQSDYSLDVAPSVSTTKAIIF